MKTWILKTAGAYWKSITALICIQGLCALLISLQPRYYQQLVSLAMDRSQNSMMAKGIVLVGLLTAIYIGCAVLKGLSGRMGAVFSSNLLKQLQIDFFEKTAQLPLLYFQKASAGEFFTKFNNDIGMSQKFVAGFLPDAVRELVTALVVTAILFYACPVILTLTALGIIIVASISTVMLNIKMAPYARAQRAGWGDINRIFDETIQGIDTLKMFGAEKERNRHFVSHTAAFRNLSVRAGSILAIFSPLIELISKLGSLLPLVLAYYLISKGDIQIEPFLLYFFYAALLNASVSNLVGSLAGIQTEITGIRNIASFFSQGIEPDESHIKSKILNRSAAISIQALTFAYPNNRDLYRSANLFIPSDAITVIHGESGSGKSTLINLLLKFYTPQKGKIFFDGVDLNEFTRSELRKKIGVVTQQHYIFQESLKANLLLAKSGAEDEEIIDALKKAHLGQFLDRLPEGIDTMMDPQGKGISAGEKQRLCISRLLLRGSKIMILDEPWSNLDENARGILSEVLNSCKKNTTILVLTHQISPELSVDKIYRLLPEKGIFQETNR